jgi:hypothetical protein
MRASFDQTIFSVVILWSLGTGLLSRTVAVGDLPGWLYESMTAARRAGNEALKRLLTDFPA